MPYWFRVFFKPRQSFVNSHSVNSACSLIGFYPLVGFVQVIPAQHLSSKSVPSFRSTSRLSLNLKTFASLGWTPVTGSNPITITSFIKEKSNVLLPLILNLYQDNEDARQNLYINVQLYTVFWKSRDNFFISELSFIPLIQRTA